MQKQTAVNNKTENDFSKESEDSKEKNSRPCPACGEELDDFTTCKECNAKLIYHNGICYFEYDGLDEE